MHITIVGNGRWKYNAEHDWATGFEGLGHTAKIIHEPSSTPTQLFEAAERSDLLLWIPSGFYNTAETVKQCSKLTAVAGWHADLFWGLDRKGWKDLPLWHADAVFTADGDHQELWSLMGVNHKWLLPGVRKQWVVKRGAPREGFLCDVAFVGNNGSNYHERWGYRAELLEHLQEMCARRGWVFRNPGGDTRNIQRDRRMNDFYRSAKVTVGDSLCLYQTRTRYWSDRVYEATGRGGVLIMPSLEHLDQQTGGWLPMYPWGDWKKLEMMVGDLLADADQRDFLRKRGKEWAMGHTYDERAKWVLKQLGLE
jgi:hypothetical protein